MVLENWGRKAKRARVLAALGLACLIVTAMFGDARAEPPASHTILKGSFSYHEPGYGDPLDLVDGCTLCHGANLNDAFAPSCYTCHPEPPPPHDFSAEPWLNPADTACTPCHDWSLNWNHAPPPPTGYIVSTTVSATTLAVLGDPTGVSIKCLGCHEGSVAVNDFTGAQNTPPYVFIDGPGFDLGDVEPFGLDLRHHHPVSFPFDSNLASTLGGLHDPTALSGLGGTPAEGGDGIARACTSCHNPSMAT